MNKIQTSLFIFLILLSTTIFAQDSYQEAIEQGDLALKNGLYKEAFNKYFAAEAFAPNKKEDVREKINQIFDKMDLLRDAAKRSRDDLESEQKKTAKTLAELVIEHEKNKRIIEAFYFYKDQYALAYKDEKYGFINKEGKIMIDYQFEEATPFSERTGFAKVKIGRYYYLYNINNNQFLLANNFLEYGENTRALDFENSPYISSGDKIYKYNFLEILLLGKNNLTELSEKISTLTSLLYLDLGNNRLSGLPTGIEQLQQLQRLQLNNNELTVFPPEIMKLQKLTSLDLSNNQLTLVPKEITALKNLKQLNLKGNDIPLNQRDSIQQSLPNCTINWE